MTVMSIKPRNSESTDEPLPHYECYLGAEDGDAEMRAMRAYWTRNAGNPEPTSVDRITSGFPTGTAAHNVTLSAMLNGAFGAYNCTARKEGKQDTTIMTIFMRSDSHVTPANRLYTQTISSGDTGIIVEMTYTNFGSDGVRWRINGSHFVQNPDDGRAYVLEDYTLFNDSVTSADNGLYESHLYTMRSNAQHALLRIIVRACPSGRWGPPGCTGICENCYNGGVCDDETGRCVCAPGFMGTNCLSVCGGNRFGYVCEFQCDTGGSEDGCQGRQFCLIDPFGCRCNTGFRDLDCNTACEEGRFGPGCLQECHCPPGTLCNRYTGECASVGCILGWSGENCQIPDTCPSHYYGGDCTSKCRCENDAPCHKYTGECPGRKCADGAMLDTDNKCQGCSDGYYGDSCEGECRCASDACDKGTGECVGCCEPHWIDILPQSCQEARFNISFEKVNPGQAATITCRADVETGHNYNLYLTTSPEDVIEPDISGIVQQDTTSSHGNGFIRRVVKVSVDNAQPTDEYYCQLRDGPTIFGWLNTSFSTYELPILADAPLLVYHNQTSVTIGWRAWDNDIDIGDPPVVEYILHVKNASNNDWTRSSLIPTTTALQYTISDLVTDATYTFSISAVRQGPGGGGPMGPEVTIKTLCDMPSFPTDVEAEVTDAEQLNITWKVPPSQTCSTGITDYTIYYYIEGVPEDVHVVEVDDTTRTWHIVRDLNPGTSYIFSVSLTTDQKSDVSGHTDPVIFPTPLPKAGSRFTVMISIIASVLLTVILAAISSACYCYRRGERENEGDSSGVVGINTAVTDEPNDYLGLDNGKTTGAALEQGAEDDQSYEVPDSVEGRALYQNTSMTSPSVLFKRPEQGQDNRMSGTEYDVVAAGVIPDNDAGATTAELEGDEYEDPNDPEDYTLQGLYINTPRSVRKANLN